MPLLDTSYEAVGKKRPMVTARISLIIAPRSPTKRPKTHVLATRNIRWGYWDLLYTMVQAFLPNHVDYEYNPCGPLYVHTLTTRLFSGRRGCIRAAATPTDDPPSTDQTTCLPEDRSVTFGAASKDGSDLETGAFSCPAGDALAASIVTSSVGFGNTHRKGI